jgi:hypothetical protein
MTFPNLVQGKKWPPKENFSNPGQGSDRVNLIADYSLLT